MQENLVELIMKIRSVENEMNRRKGTERLLNYNAGDVIHKKQMDFHRCPKKNRWVFGGNRTGKTECGAVETVWLLRGIHPFRQNRKNVSGWVVSVSYEVQREVAQQKILSYLSPEWISDIVMQSGRKDNPHNGVIDTIEVKNVFGGTSRLSFKSADQGREKFQGASLDFVWFDEEPPKDIYEECLMRVLDRKGDLFCTMTPLKGLSWVYDEIFLNAGNNAEIWYEQMEWRDNPYLDKNEVEKLIASTSDDLQESRRFGRFADLHGQVFPEFDENLHVIDPFPVPREWQCNISIDPGLKNPLSCHFYAVDGDGVIYVVAEHYEAQKDIKYHAGKIFEIADSIGWARDRDGRLRALIDSAAEQKTLASLKSVAELFYENGILVNTKVDKSLFGGISRMKEIFGSRPPRIYIFRNCVNMIRELKGYRWGDGDRPVKRDDHAVDELRYFVTSRPEPSVKESISPSVIEKDKNDLVRKLKNRNYERR